MTNKLEYDLSDIVNDFNELADYKILKESRKRYKIHDNQLGDVDTIKKKFWYEKILTFYIDEILNSKDIMEGATIDDYKRLVGKVQTLYWGYRLA